MCAFFENSFCFSGSGCGTGSGISGSDSYSGSYSSSTSSSPSSSSLFSLYFELAEWFYLNFLYNAFYNYGHYFQNCFEIFDFFCRFTRNFPGNLLDFYRVILYTFFSFLCSLSFPSSLCRCPWL